MTPDPLSAFIAARLAEDEATAIRAAECEKLRLIGADRGLPPGDWSWLADYGQPQPGDIALIDHQVRFDPARVLRDVAAKRAILAEHWAHSEPERWIDGPKAGQATGRTAYWCSTCDQDRDYGYISGPQEGCATLRHLAAIDAGHPDYDPSWAPGSS